MPRIVQESITSLQRFRRIVHKDKLITPEIKSDPPATSTQRFQRRPTVEVNYLNDNVTDEKRADVEDIEDLHEKDKQSEHKSDSVSLR